MAEKMKVEPVALGGACFLTLMAPVTNGGVERRCGSLPRAQEHLMDAETYLHHVEDIERACVRFAEACQTMLGEVFLMGAFFAAVIIASQALLFYFVVLLELQRQVELLPFLASECFPATVFVLRHFVALRFRRKRLLEELMDNVQKVGANDWTQQGLQFRIQESGPWPWTYRSKKKKAGLSCKYSLSLFVEAAAGECQGTTLPEKDSEGRPYIVLPTYDYLNTSYSPNRLLQERVPKGLEHMVTAKAYAAEAELINAELRRRSPFWTFHEWSRDASWKDFMPLILFSPLFLISQLLGYFHWGEAAFVLLVTLASYDSLRAAYHLARRHIGDQDRMDEVLADINKRWQEKGLVWERKSETVRFEQDGFTTTATTRPFWVRACAPVVL